MAQLHFALAALDLRGEDTAGQERFHRFAQGGKPGPAGGPQGRPVIAAAPGDDLVAALLAGLPEILPRHFDGGLVGFAAAVEEEGHFEVAGSDLRKFFRQQDQRRGKTVVVVGEKLQRFELGVDGMADLFAPVTDGAGHQIGKGVEKFIAVDVGDPAPLAAGEDLDPLVQIGIAHPVAENVLSGTDLETFLFFFGKSRFVHDVKSFLRWYYFI